MSKLKTWIIASRAETLPVSIAPVALATVVAFADGVFNLLIAFFCLLFSVLVHLATNFTNDYFDFKNGVDSAKGWGKLRITENGIVNLKSVKRVISILFILATLALLPIVWQGGLVIALLGLAAMAIGFLYTGGPMPLGYVGLGDLTVLLFFGPVATIGTYYAQALSVNQGIFLLSFVPGFISTAILVINDLRDVKSDKFAGKRSLAVVLGKRFSQIEYLFCILSATLFFSLFFLQRGLMFGAYLSLIIPLLAIAPAKKVLFASSDIPSLNKALESTAKMHIAYFVVFVICMFTGYVL